MNYLKSLLKNDWIIGLFLFLVFFVTNGYTYAWDDQHIEIPLLKSLIDPSLYVGDYYVQSLKHNFTTFLFPLLAKIISVQQIPAAYFILYLLSRFFLFFYAFKLWEEISRDRLTATLCVLSFILVMRVEEFLYRTFSHQEFALAIIMAGLYYFYKNRFLIAAALFGIAANFHGLYSLFPFAYMAFYLLWNAREEKGAKIFKTLGIFTLCALPFLVWTFQRFATRTAAAPGLYENWIALYQIACPQNFLFLDQPLSEMFKHVPIFLKGTQQFWPPLALLAFNLVHNSLFRKDTKTLTLISVAGGMILLSFIFSYLVPNRFVLDLNLVRNLQYIQFILAGYTTMLLVKESREQSWIVAILLVLLFSLLRFGNYAAVWATLAMIFLLKATKGNRQAWIAFVLALIVTIFQITRLHLGPSVIAAIVILVFSLTGIYASHVLQKNEEIRKRLRYLLLLLPFVVITANFVYFHYLRLKVEQTGTGFWQMQRNWIDMQNFVRLNTPKNSLLLVPNDMEMGGFRILSERKVLVCYRDCGIIGFDYAAAVEWQKRLKDVEHFKVFVDGDIRPAIVKAVTQYRVNYIVFMRYLDPGKNELLDPVYKNEVFSLYKVLSNPAL